VRSIVIATCIAKAKNLLRFTGERIADIARNTGLADANYFSRVFAKQTGMSAREFRRQSRAAGEI